LAECRRSYHFSIAYTLAKTFELKLVFAKRKVTALWRNREALDEINEINPVNLVMLPRFWVVAATYLAAAAADVGADFWAVGAAPVAAVGFFLNEAL